MLSGRMKVKLFNGCLPSFFLVVKGGCAGRHCVRSDKRDRRKAVDRRLAPAYSMFAAIPIGLFLIGAVVVFEGELVVTEAVPR